MAVFWYGNEFALESFYVICFCNGDNLSTNINWYHWKIGASVDSVLNYECWRGQ